MTPCWSSKYDVINPCLFLCGLGPGQSGPSPPGWSSWCVAKQRMEGGEGLANIALDCISTDQSDLTEAIRSNIIHDSRGSKPSRSRVISPAERLKTNTRAKLVQPGCLQAQGYRTCPQLELALHRFTGTCNWHSRETCNVC